MSEITAVRYGSAHWDALRGEFVEAQAGQCAVCTGSILEDAQLDHCHDSGFVRGALCRSCNMKLGWYEGKRREIETYLARAAEYQAYAVAERMERKPEPRKPSSREWLRAYWQRRAMEMGRAG